MSRVGKLPVSIPSGVSVSLDAQLLSVKGPKGTLARHLPSELDVEVDERAITVKRRDDSLRSRSLHGLTRALVNNMVQGVSQGFTRILEIQGVGYRVDVQNNVLHLTLGYSHPIQFPLPDGVKATVERQTIIHLEATDKELLGQTAAQVRALRSVEPYKGKGIRYGDEQVRRKAGKAGKK
jgi:large subunit ribosomal protein L6